MVVVAELVKVEEVATELVEVVVVVVEVYCLEKLSAMMIL